MKHNQKDIRLGQGRFSEQFTKTSLDNNATYNYVSIMSGMAMIESLFGDTPNEDDYLDHALNCMRHIGNVHIDLYGFVGQTDDNGEVCLPISAIGIEYVTNGREDNFTWSVRSQLSQLHAPGKYLHYKFLGDKLVLDFPNIWVSVAYWAEKMDEEGNLLITEQEAEACAYWWVWVDSRRKARKGYGPAIQYLQQAVFDKNKSINQARIPDHFSQNFMDQWADIVYSRDRKDYNISYKPVKI